MAGKYSEDFREDVVRLVRGGMKVTQASADMGVPVATIYEWLRRSDIDDVNRKTWDSRDELRGAITLWIERNYHRKRRQRALGKLTPLEFEMIHKTVAKAA